MSYVNDDAVKEQKVENATSQIDYQTVWQKSAPPFAWGTIALFFSYLVGYAIIIWAALSELVSYIVATPVCAYLAYVGFTIVHDAGHGSIIQLGSRCKSLETLMGWVAAFPLLLVPFPAFKRLHDRHHAFTNDPDRDPDHFSFGEKWYQVTLNCLYIPVQYHLLMLTKLRHIKSVRATYLTTIIYFLVIISAIIWLTRLGYFNELLFLLIIPNVIAVFLLAMFFDYIPHYPHKSVNRYQNTRVIPGRFLNALLLGQNYHLAHHMYPRVPWYKYKEVYENIKPDLDAHSSPIDHLTTVQALSSGIYPKLLTSPHAYGLVDNGNKVEMLLRVSKIASITEESVEIVFELPPGTRLNFKAGQYIVLSKWLAVTQISRSYSLFNSPLSKSNELAIAVKKHRTGIFSSYLNNKLSVGDELVISGPFGDFVYPPKYKVELDNLILIAAGSGITPVLSILKTALKEPARKIKNITLVYVNKCQSKTIFYQELQTLTAQYPTKLAIDFLFSEKIKNDGSSVKDALKKCIGKAHQSQQTAYYICGPESFNHFVSVHIEKSDAKANNIFVEQFTRQTSQPIGKQFVVDIQKKDGSKHRIFVASNQTVLEVAKLHNVNLPYACESGHCGTCKCKIIKGKQVPIQDSYPALSREDKKAGYTLACKLKPTEAIIIKEVGI